MSQAPNNKFDISTTFGDPRASYAESRNDNKEDFAQDSAGVPNVDQGEKTNLDMGLEPNKFPRETGHDSLSPEEAQLA